MKKKLYQCPDCKAILLKDTSTDETYWQDLTCHEQSAIEVMFDSKPLRAIIGSTKLTFFLCNECNDKRNPVINLN